MSTLKQAWLEKTLHILLALSVVALALIIASGFYAMTNLPYAAIIRGWWL